MLRLAGLAGLFLTTPLRADEPPPLRVMPLGDSITYGCCSGAADTGGYRVQLFSRLQAAGYTIDYVGGRNGPAGSPLPDQDHEGTSGFRVDQITDRLAIIDASIDDPDAVLVLAGTNDFGQSYDVPRLGERFEALLNELAARFPEARILVGTLLLRTDDPGLDQALVAFNATLPELVADQQALGRKVSLVATRSALAADDLYDGVHPNPEGYDKLGDAWFDALVSELTPYGPAGAPVVVDIDAHEAPDEVTVVFNKPLADAAADPANFVIDGGVTVESAGLDSETKRRITLGTSAQPPGMTLTLSITGVHERSPAGELIAPDTELTFSTRVLENGSFEDGYAGWTPTGNQELQDHAGSGAFDGQARIAFNAAELPPNGTLEQDFQTTPGQAYRLDFATGTLSYVTQPQELGVVITGGVTLLDETVPFTGRLGGFNRWYQRSFAFVAESTTTTLRFEDRSPTTSGLDLLLDDVRIHLIENKTVSVASLPESGVEVIANPPDGTTTAGGLTPFDLVYADSGTITLTAPASHLGRGFQKWQKDGSDVSEALQVTVPLTANVAMTAVYAEGAPVIIADPQDQTVGRGQTVTFTVEAEGDEPLAYQWRRNGAGIPGENSPDLTLSDLEIADSGFYDVVVSNAVGTKTSASAALSVFEVGPLANGGFEDGYEGWTASGNQAIASPFAEAPEGEAFVRFNGGQLPADAVLGQSFATTPGLRYNLEFAVGTFAANTNQQLLGVTVEGASPLVSQTYQIFGAGGGQFRWEAATYGFTADDDFVVLTFRDLSPTTTNIDLLLDDVRIVPQPARGGVANGSFEFGLGGWTPGGSVQLASTGPYVGSEGATTLVFNGADGPNDGTLFQEFITEPGLVYTLEFDAGLLAFLGTEQHLGVRVSGAAELLNETIALAGSGSGSAVYTAHSYTFTADSELTRLEFSDESATTSQVDLLLDHVRVASEGEGILADGSFEDGLLEWIASGNLEISSPSTDATDGMSLVAFNTGQSPPNGELSQQIDTIAGLTYRIEFDLGVVAANIGEQTLGLEVDSDIPLLAESFTITGPGGGATSFETRSTSFVASGASATLRFRDLSSTTFNIDMLLDRVRVIREPARDSVANGSFENGLEVWRPAGSVLTAGETPYIPTDGAVLAVFNGGGGPNDGTLVQEFSTTPGEEYVLHFDAGTLSFAQLEQRLLAELEGTSPILSETVVLGGTGDGSAAWESFTFPFTAESATTLLRLRDVSTTTDQIDLLLDNVRVSLATADGTTFRNGSFEDGYDGWIRSGNQSIVSPTAAATDGEALVTFNGGQKTPNAVLAQTFATTPGQAYRLEFDLGVLAANNAQQTVGVEVFGDQTLLSVTESIIGAGGGAVTFRPITHTFIADRAVTSLRFSDLSPTTTNIDMLLDHVRVTEDLTHTFSLASSPGAGVIISATPPDRAGMVSVATPADLVYSVGTEVTLDAPEVSGELAFLRWDKDGSAFADSASITLTADADAVLTAVYAEGAPRILEHPAGRSVAQGRPTTFSVSAEGEEPLFYQWRKDGVEIAGETGSSLTIFPATTEDAGGYDVVVTNSLGGKTSETALLEVVDLGVISNGGFEDGAQDWTSSGNLAYESGSDDAFAGDSFVIFNNGQTTPDGLLFQSVPTVSGQSYRLEFALGTRGSNSQPQRLGVAVAGTQTLLSEVLEIYGQSGGAYGWATVGFTFIADSDETTITFSDLSPTGLNIDLLLDAVVVTPQLPEGELLNGSFENGYDGWLAGGNQALVSEPPYAATDGAVLLVFNGGDAAPDGTISQQFATIPGETYLLDFDLGVLAGATGEQRMRVRVSGAGTLLDEVMSLQGAAGGDPEFTSFSLSFTADAETAELTFEDISPTTEFIDLLLDHVRVRPESGPQARLQNGGFEEGLVNWVLTGNGERVFASPDAAEGSAYISFNSGQSQPNGVLNRTLEVSPGRRYRIGFQLGVVAANQNLQQLEVRVAGESVLLSAIAVISGQGGGTYVWEARSFEFVADSDSVDLRFSDLSGTSFNIDLLLDAVTLEALPPLERVFNGSFERDLDGWTATGNQVVFSGEPYAATEGQKLVVLNGSSGVPDAVLSQEIETVPGETYTLEFDLGAYAFTTDTMELHVTAEGDTVLLDERAAVTGQAGGSNTWVTAGYEFTADSSLTTLVLRDVSTATEGIDLLLDRISLSAEPPPPELAVNGSFEDAFTGWTSSGNQLIVGNSPNATDGLAYIAFNAGQSTPNGVLEQDIPTEAGVRYSVRFDIGVLAYNGNEQRLALEVMDGSSSTLLQETVSIFGQGGGSIIWQPRGFTFTATGETTTVRFRDTSPSTTNLDLLLDRVSVTEDPAD